MNIFLFTVRQFSLIDMMTEFKFKVKTNLTTIHKPQDQSKMDNPEKLGTQDEEKQNKTQHNTICIGYLVHTKYNIFKESYLLEQLLTSPLSNVWLCFYICDRIQNQILAQHLVY